MLAEQTYSSLEDVSLNEGKMVTLSIPFPGTNEKKVLAQAKEIGSKNGFTVHGGEYDRYDEAVYVTIKGDSSKLAKWVNKWMRTDDSEEEIVNDYSESVDATESALNEAEEDEFSHSKDKKQNYAKFLAANAKRVGKPMIDGGLKVDHSKAANVNGQPVNDVIYVGDGCLTFISSGKKVFMQLNPGNLNTSDGTVPWSVWKSYSGNAYISASESEFKEIAKALTVAAKV
jgi:hypothetical protein